MQYFPAGRLFRQRAFFIVLLLSFFGGFAGMQARLDEARAPQIRPQLYVPHDGIALPRHLLHRPDAGSYLPNAVIIKTKEFFSVPQGATTIPSSVLQYALVPLNVQAVRSVFPSYAETAQKQKEGVQSSQDVGLGRIYEVHYQTPTDAYDACVILQQNPAVEYATPVYRRDIDYTPNDFSVQNQYALSKIQAEQAWSVSKGSAQVIIAIIDTGIDWQHEDLAGNIFVNTKEIPNNGVDDDKNGKIDDIHGWDFVGNTSFDQIIQGNFNEDNDPKVMGDPAFFDPRSHGTYVAGNAAAITDNGKGVASIGFNCKILPIKCGSDNLNAQGVYRGYEAILYAAQMGAKVINCSWGGGGENPAENDVIKQAVTLGAVVVAATGNASTLIDLYPLTHYPSGYDGVLSVGATDDKDAIAGYSSYGARTMVYAPGSDVLSTAPGNSYNWNSGTSFSSPIIAGIAGLVRSFHPTWTPAQVIHQIRSTSDNVLVPSKPNQRYLYYGRVNAYRALQLNQNFSSGQTIPGIGSTDISIPGSPDNAIISTNQTAVNFTIENFLAPTAGVLDVKFESLDGMISFSQAAFTLNPLGTLQSQTLNLSVQPVSYLPWLDGYADVLVTYKSGTYTDYERIRIPIRLPSNNSYTTLGNYAVIPETAVWNAATTPDFSSFVAVGTIGNSSAILRANTSFIIALDTGAFSLSAKPPYAVCALDQNRFFVGVNLASGGQAEVLKTTNGSAPWTKIGVSLITGFINSIHFFDSQNGVIVGDPLGIKWGVGTTSNSGDSWTGVNVNPAPQNGESGLVGSACWLQDHGWFGTTKGRVYHTTDRGKNWTASTVMSGGTVIALSFSTVDQGIALYRAGSDAAAPVFVASTTDGGKTWETGRHDFSKEKLVPIATYTAPNSGQNLVVGNGSQISSSNDNGSAWGVTPTRQIGPVAAGAGILSGTTVRLWAIGASIGYVDTKFVNLSAQKEIALNVNSLAFGVIGLGTPVTKTFTIRNTGAKTVKISGVSVTPGKAVVNEFKVGTTLPLTINAADSAQVQVVFTPTQKGARSATLTVESDAQSDNGTVSLSGFGQSASDVGESARGDILAVQHYPDPAFDISSLDCILAKPEYMEIQLLNVLGQTISVPFAGMMQAGMTTVRTSVALLAPGMYFYRVQGSSGFVTRSFIVQH